MLIGTYEEIKKIISEKLDKILIFKCCMITNSNNLNLKLIKSEFKFPIFRLDDDIRSILEYHSLGQIWILNGDKNKLDILSNIFKYSVDTLNIKLKENPNLVGKNLLQISMTLSFMKCQDFME